MDQHSKVMNLRSSHNISDSNIEKSHRFGREQMENFNKTLGKAIKVAAFENKNWKQEMHKFLRNYRATPHCATKIAPAKALFDENIKTTFT